MAQVSLILLPLLGAPIAAVAMGVVLFLALPLDPPWAFAVGVHAIPVIWVALVCWLPLIRRPRFAWAICAAPVLVLGLLRCFQLGPS